MKYTDLKTSRKLVGIMKVETERVWDYYWVKRGKNIQWELKHRSFWDARWEKGTYHLIHEWYGKGKKWQIIPAHDLDDLLSVLPREIKGEYRRNIDIYHNEVSYDSRDTCGSTIIIEYDKDSDLLQALADLLLWLHSEGLMGEEGDKR